mgnify:FL=1|jgi:DeoR/GlpR family transcriptional regulator of sugar metabolism
MNSSNHASLQRQLKQLEQEDQLLPRRKEILNIIRDHSPCSFDKIHRRFHSTPTSTIHYDLQQLQKVGLIKKLGATRGALYTI